MIRRFDVAIVGGGILGLAHAWSAARRGLSVALFERDRQASGASVRNFGMIWPIGQPAGERLHLALTSRSIWRELSREAGFWLDPCGSLHLAYHDDEWHVLHEFADRASDRGYSCEMLSSEQTLRRFPAVVADGLRGSLYSHTECCVDPRQAIALLPQYLSQKFGVACFFGQTVVSIESPRLRTASGKVFEAERILICSGNDFDTLFPEELARAALRRCKLQMMRTVPQPKAWRLGPHVAGGLTLSHYTAFADCPTLVALRHRIETTMPEYVRYGIHVMASQNQLGEVILGDSHEYEEEIEPFDKPFIDELILDYLNKLIRLPVQTLQARWNGIYVKHAQRAIYSEQLQPGVFLRVAPGGAGMTLSFGLAEKFFAD